MASTNNADRQSPDDDERAARATPTAVDPRRTVRQFREILLWPLQLMPRERDTQTGNWDLPLRSWPAAIPIGQRSASAIPADPRALKEHVYREFVSFLPHVQRFLYGGGRGRDGSNRVFSRADIARARITLTSGAAPLLLDVPRVELHFFCDIDVAILAVEIEGRDLALDDVQDVMYRFGRSYPSGWTDRGEAWHCPERVEWLDREGGVLATSDYERRDNFLASVCREQVPTIAAHWKFLLAPLRHGGEAGPLCYGLVEHNWIPLMAYLAVADPQSLTPNDHARLGLVLPPGDPASAPYAAAFLQDFDKRYCYDRFHDRLAPATGSTRASCVAAMPL